VQQYQLFLESIRLPETKKVYTIYFKKYVEFMGGEESDLFCGNDPRLIERHIIDFIISLKERGLGYFAIRNYVVTVTSFYKINDIILNTTKIGKL
jgi:hypothetical protein